MAPIHPDSEPEQFYDMSPPKRLGRGRHAIVFECRDPTGRVYAMKLFKQHSRDRISREIEILQYLSWSSADFYRPDEDLDVCVGLFKPPELLLSYERYDFSIDMWCFGAMLAAMVFRKEPFFHGISLIDQLKTIADVLGTDKLYRFVNEYDLELDEEELEVLGQRPEQPWTDFINSANRSMVTDEAISLIDQLLRFDPKERLTAAEAIRNVYFRPF
ncbi:CMGC CK2 kinase [Fusarium beomiforme]|uniref:non-specific serine/threonine protein kinase n=1 Tax=Fusarium beomiforme TaxID=44412 RepID=A0A9P5DXJ6_9HYPO|nr:CMGC CK2 kinase [Fusarium beomiforme]